MCKQFVQVLTATCTHKPQTTVSLRYISLPINVMSMHENGSCLKIP